MVNRFTHLCNHMTPGITEYAHSYPLAYENVKLLSTLNIIPIIQKSHQEVTHVENFYVGDLLCMKASKHKMKSTFADPVRGVSNMHA